MTTQHSRDVVIPVGTATVGGELVIPEGAQTVVVFAHGSGSSRHSPRNQMVAKYLVQHGLGTLLFDLLTEDEDQEYANRFRIDLLASRLVAATEWLQEQPEARGLAVSYFGASTGAAAALMAAAALPRTAAVVSRGGRPDLALGELPDVKAPTLLIVGSRDEDVLRLNRKALERLTAEKDLAVVEGATHLFEERGTMEEVCRLAADWLTRHQ